MGELPEATPNRAYVAEVHHHNLLASAIGDQKLAGESIIHNYGKSFNGFVAQLLPDEAEKLLEQKSVVSVFPNTRRKLHTTRSWNFLRMPLTPKRRSKTQTDIVVGIWVDSPSFNDKGFGPPPRSWKGKCVTGANFTGCNNKVIGAKYFNIDDEALPEESPSPADENGHGTHTASTAAGMPVRGASMYGIGRGTARGGVPSARIAMYKVCWSVGCSDMNILAAFDEAIADGVDVISVSIGGPTVEFFSDPIAIGAFHAMKRGILTSCSAGNTGPYPMTIENVAPWIMTVAASSIDRQFTTKVSLGNGEAAPGLSVNTFSPKKKMYPLINGVLAAKGSGADAMIASFCDYETLSKKKVKGKIVYCLEGMSAQDYTIKRLGGVGIIVALAEKTDVSSTTIIPGTFVEANTVGKSIDLYINSTKNAQAVIHKTTSSKIAAPFVASFSSRGPQRISRNLLKPDLAAPGLNILAAYSKLATLTGVPEDTRHSIFNIMSGTSMACPHASGAAAFVKSFHPDWSPAAIKSALMTTATPMKIMDMFGELGSGSGQINPARAVDPGLVYDIKMNDYIAFLCKQGFDKTKIALLIGNKGFNCSNIRSPPGDDGINYPSMNVQLMTANSNISAVFHRTVKNVALGTSTYNARVTSPKGFSVEVIPSSLKFNKLYQEQKFKVVVKGPPMPDETLILSGFLEWNDSKHSVKTPILVSKPLSEFD
ncbi:subtilisin-like protease SBT4.15 [Senna tora]|uniref:Subtilisin-like protease SBT4.15 n=1 Tax=Senna tora TaxID=362788 RepID=A0A834WCX2_9FABA|nr:subtilisin-like protease SBT4.15 [Senna tora]